MAPPSHPTTTSSVRSPLQSRSTGAAQAFPGRDAREVLIHHLKGQPRPPREIDPSLPPQISETILRALHRDPDQRFQSAAELAKALAGHLEEAVA